MKSTSPDPRDTNRYEIRVNGRLDDRWSVWFDGLALTSQQDGTTVIEAAGIDQATLHGLLRQVRDAGLRLISVTHIDPGTDPDTD
jgi:hypothetical protein